MTYEVQRAKVNTNTSSAYDLYYIIERETGTTLANTTKPEYAAMICNALNAPSETRNQADGHYA